MNLASSLYTGKDFNKAARASWCKCRTSGPWDRQKFAGAVTITIQHGLELETSNHAQQLNSNFLWVVQYPTSKLKRSGRNLLLPGTATAYSLEDGPLVPTRRRCDHGTKGGQAETQYFGLRPSESG